MSIRFWLASASMLAGYALVSSGAGCLVVSSKSGTGGSGSVTTTTTVTPMSATGPGSGGGSGVTSTSTMMTTTSTSSGMCKETGVDHCSSCVNPPYGCGVAATNQTLLVCDFNAGNKNSLDIYTDLFDCICGVDGNGGYCGSQCSKTCKGTGADAGGCQGCLGNAFTSASKCSAQFSACSKD